MKEWIKSLCPEIADWQAEFIAEAAHNMVLDENEAAIEDARTVGGEAGAEMEKLIRARGNDAT